MLGVLNSSRDRYTTHTTFLFLFHCCENEDIHSFISSAAQTKEAKIRRQIAGYQGLYRYKIDEKQTLIRKYITLYFC